MSTVWPSLWLLILIFLLFVEVRLLGGRLTLGARRLLLVFSYGAAGATILNLAAQRLAIIALPLNTVAWSLGPFLEEFAKVLPVLLLAYGFSGRRRLTIADYALVGVTSGLGFEFVESNLRAVVAGNSAPEYFWLVGGGTIAFDKDVYWAAGHALWTGFISLGIGIGVRLWPRDARRFIPFLAAATLSWFEHTMFNWKGTHTETFFGQIQSIARAPEWAETLYAIDLHGLLTLILFPTLLLAATVLEGRWTGKPLAERRELMLPDEGLRPFVPQEWIALIFAIPRGRMEFFRIARYFRRRRELALTSTEGVRGSDNAGLLPAAAYLDRLVDHEREEIDVPVPARWLPAPGEAAAAVGAFVRQRWLTLSVLALVLILFMVAPHALPAWLRAFLFGSVFNLILLVVAAVLLVWRVRDFKAKGAPDPKRSDTEALVSHRLRILLLSSSAISLVFAVVAWFLSARTLAGSGAFITSAFGTWLNDGGGPALLTLGPLLATAVADPVDKDPCDDLKREADLADARIKELEKRAKNWKRPEPPPEGWQQDRMPISGKKSDSDNMLGRVAKAAGKTGVGKRVIQICKPIMGKDGRILGYAMVEEVVDDNAPNAGGATTSNGGDPNTIYLPGGRRLHVDPFEEWLTGKSTVQEALDQEREAQKKRLAALAGCGQAGTLPMTREKPKEKDKPKKLDLDGLQKEIDDAKREFEELEKKLHEAAGKNLEAIQTFLQEYDKQWKVAVDALGNYLERYRDLIPDYKKILEQFASRADALKYAAFADEVYQTLAAELLPEFLPGGALAATEAKVAATGAKGAQAASAARTEAAVARAEAQGGSAALNAERAEAEALSNAAQKGKTVANELEGGSGAVAKASTVEKEAAATEAKMAQAKTGGTTEGAGTTAETEAAAAKAAAKADAEAASELRALRQKQIDSATLSKNADLKEGVMQDEVQKAIQSGATNKRELLFFGDDANSLEAVSKGVGSWGKSKDGWIVSVHGLEGGEGFAIYTKVGDSMQYVKVSPSELAQMMREAGYKEGAPIRLISCWSGSGPQPAAQALARELKAPITAPKGAINMSSNGNFTVTGAPAGEKNFVTYGADGSIQ